MDFELRLMVDQVGLMVTESIQKHVIKHLFIEVAERLVLYFVSILDDILEPIFILFRNRWEMFVLAKTVEFEFLVGTIDRKETHRIDKQLLLFADKTYPHFLFIFNQFLKILVARMFDQVHTH